MGNACCAKGAEDAGLVEVAGASTSSGIDAYAPAANNGLTITFVHDGKDLDITFPKKPLGFNFKSDVAPLLVSRTPAGSQGDALGLKVGMQIKSIGGTDVFAMSYEEAVKIIKDRVALLPSA